MIVERLDLIAYGRFTDTRIDLSAGPRRFHIIYGPNESGKSTSLRAITSLLYGMTTRAEDNYLHAPTKIRVGGVLADADGNSLVCIRRRGRKGTLRQVDDSTVIPDAKIHAMLGGVDREAFEHRFGLSHEELVQGGKAILEGGGDLGEILFAAGAGVSQLKAVQAKLDESGSDLFVAGGSKGAINILVREIAEKKRNLEEAKILPREWESLQNDLTQQRNQTRDLESNLHDAAVKLSKLRAFQDALPIVPQWRALAGSLRQLIDVPRLDDAFIERRRSLDSNRQIARAATDSLNARITELRRELEQLGDDSVILIHEAEIASLFQRLGEREKARTDRVDLQRKRKSLDRRMIESLEELSIEITVTGDDAVTEQIDASLKRLRLVDAVRTHVNKLAQQYAMLVQQRDDADEELRSLKRNFDELRLQIGSEAIPNDPAGIGQIIESVGSPESILSSLSQQQADVKQSRVRCAHLARKLDSICPTTTGAFADAVCECAKLRLPSEAAIAHSAGELDQRESAFCSAGEQWKQLDLRERKLTQKLEATGSLGELPTTDQLNDARDQRDELYGSLLADHGSGSLSTSNLIRLQCLIRKADELVDKMRQHHEQIHSLATIQADLDEIQNQKSIAQASKDTAKADFEVAQANWQALWQPVGVIAAAPQLMERWIVTHTQLMEAVADLEEESDRVERCVARIVASCQRLRHGLASVVTDRRTAEAQPAGTLDVVVDQAGGTVAMEDFPKLYDEAVRLRTHLQHARKRYDERITQQDSLQVAIPKSAARLESCQQQLDRWDSDWTAATSALAASVDRTPAVILEKIKQIDDLNAQQRERDIVLHRINAMFADDKTYRSDVARLASTLGSEFDEHEGEIRDAFTLVKDFFERLQNERSNLKQRTVRIQQLEVAQQELAAAKQRVSEADVALERLCEEALCEDPSQLTEVEQRSKQRQQIEQSKESYEKQLRLLSGSVPLDDFVHDVSQQQAKLLELEIEHLEAKFAESQTQLSQSQQTLGRLQERMEKIDGGGKAAELSQELQFLTGELDNEIEQYARVKIASMILRQAIDDYRQENQGPVLELASNTFQQLTRGEYSSLKVDFDARGKAILFGVRSTDGESDVPANAMSTGTTDALYLSLRLASIDHQLSRGTPLPLVVDDCLVQLDDDRSAAALRALSDLSLRTQVILFTHHEHLIELAERTLAADEYHVRRLG